MKLQQYSKVLAFGLPALNTSTVRWVAAQIFNM
jgi:hypothetical protein